MLDTARWHRTHGSSARSSALEEQAIEKRDDRLRLLLVCAHPAIDVAVRTPLMLQTVLGLEAARIARAFLVTPAAMSQRLVRAKSKIRDAGIPFEEPEDRAERMHAVREAIYAAFAVGHDEDGSESLAEEALDLARLVTELAPDDAESLGLYALLRLSHARHGARARADGAFVALTEQDVTKWDRAAILEANAVLLRAASHRVPGPFQLEAAIQSAHAQRLFSGQTPWNAIELLYASLNASWPTVASLVAHAAVLVEIGRVAEADALLRDLDPAHVEGYGPHWVVLAHVRRHQGIEAAAREASTRAKALATSTAVRAFLERTLAADEG
ncbi:MAG: RNA polymerase subunit sigma-70 [Deltaproteobacteria bacterium]|nr:RNA polymerase subunit sigma-70 [Deltaproteobacteria bacterium]